MGDSKGGRVKVKYRPQSLKTVTKRGKIIIFSLTAINILFLFLLMVVLIDGSMDGNAIDMYRVSALSVNAELHSVGCVVFCKDNFQGS